MNTQDALNILAKWRSVYASWQLGTRSKDDAESEAVRDTQERLLILRAEQSAFVRILIEKGIVSAEEFDRILGEEALTLSQMLEGRWPGARAASDGIHYEMEKAREWMTRFPP
jgi:hypothetical protein